jgi:hypothetical protein
MSANHKKDWVRNSQISKVAHLRKIRKSKKIFKFANLQICVLRNLFADRPLLNFSSCVFKKRRNLLLVSSGDFVAYNDFYLIITEIKRTLYNKN